MECGKGVRVMADEFKNSVDIYDELQRCVDGLKDLQQQISHIDAIHKAANANGSNRLAEIEKRIGNIRIENGWPEVSGINKRLDALEASGGPYEAGCDMRKRITDLEDMVVGKRVRQKTPYVQSETSPGLVDIRRLTEEAKIGRMILNIPAGMSLVRDDRNWVYGPSNDPFSPKDIIYYPSLLETLTKAGLDK
jgi:hypothetical protein